jgi:tetratricopeptide (TPR) repeat protein
LPAWTSTCWPQGDAAVLLLRRTEGRRRATPADQSDAAALAKDLGYLALALEQAGAYIAAAPLPMSLAEYRTLLRDSFAEVMDWSDPLLTHYPRAVAATWQTSVACLDEAARVLLERLAFLAPDPVPAALLDVVAPAAAPDEARGGLRGLATYSLISAAADGASFTVHRLVQDVTRRGMEAAGTARDRLTEALGWVNKAFAGQADDVRSWPALDPLAPHAEAVAAHADAAGITDPAARLMNQLGALLWAKALHAQAEPLMRRALVIDEASLGKDHPTVAIDLNNLAQLLQDTNRLGEAEPLMRRALAIDEASLGKDHPNVAIRLNNLGALLHATNRPGEAEQLMRRALAIFVAFQRSTGHAHPHRDAAIRNYVGLLEAMKRSAPEIDAAIATLQREAGLDQGNSSRGMS